MSTEPTNFEDPALKQAVARVMGGHQASAELRAKVLALAEAPPSLAVARGPAVWFRRAAIAAAVVIVAGVGLRAGLHQYHEYQERQEFVADNASLLDDMLTLAASVPGGATAAPTDAAALGQALARPVTLPELKARGFTLSRSELTTVRGKPAARLEYTSAASGTTAVLLLLDASLLAEVEEGEVYDLTRGGYQIAGVARDGGLQCMLVSSSSSVSAVSLLP